jgi:metal-responsive CopG/Arc/MetJ family transcriptional regulator
MALSEGNVQISVTLPKEIVEKYLDRDAKNELRTRSKQAAKIILEYYKSEIKKTSNNK